MDRLDGWTGSAVARDRRGIGGGWTGSGDGDGWTVDRIGGGLGGGVLGRFEAGRGRQWRGLGGGGFGDVDRWTWTAGPARSASVTWTVATWTGAVGGAVSGAVGDGLGGPWRLDRIGGDGLENFTHRPREKP